MQVNNNIQSTSEQWDVLHSTCKCTKPPRTLFCVNCETEYIGLLIGEHMGKVISH